MRARAMTGLMAVVMLAGMAMTSSVARAADDPMAGTWQMNPAKSKYIPGPAPKSLTSTIKVDGDTETFTSDGTDAAGKATHSAFTAKFGGPDAPVTGIPYADTIALKRVTKRSVVATLKKGGKVTMTVHVVVASDGKSRTLSYSGKNENGKAVHDVVVYDRQ